MAPKPNLPGIGLIPAPQMHPRPVPGAGSHRPHSVFVAGPNTAASSTLCLPRLSMQPFFAACGNPLPPAPSALKTKSQGNLGPGTALPPLSCAGLPCKQRRWQRAGSNTSVRIPSAHPTDITRALPLFTGGKEVGSPSLAGSSSLHPALSHGLVLSLEWCPSPPGLHRAATLTSSGHVPPCHRERGRHKGQTKLVSRGQEGPGAGQGRTPGVQAPPAHATLPGFPADMGPLLRQLAN